MKTQFATLTLAVLGGLGAMAMPGISHAATVGHYFNCAGQGTTAMANAITASGHTPVNVAVPNAATLATLDVLWVNHNYAVLCPSGDDEWMANLAAINDAVQNHGLTLLVFDRVVNDSANGTIASTFVPGASSISFVDSPTANIDLPAGSPLLAEGLDNTTLDGGNSSAHGYGVASTLPGGAQIWANDGTADHASMFSYPLGVGTVVYSTFPLDHYLENGYSPVAFSSILAPAAVKLAAGIQDNEVDPETPTCAESGYTGTKLLWCQKICESGLTGKALEDWIHRWINRYRELPTCAAGGGEGEGGGEEG